MTYTAIGDEFERCGFSGGGHHPGMWADWINKRFYTVGLQADVFFIATFVAICTYPILSNFIVNNTDMDDKIKMSILDKALPAHQEKLTEEVNGGKQNDGDIKNIDLSKIPLPGKLREQLENFNFADLGVETASEPDETTDGVVEEAWNAFALMLVNIISAVLIFIAVRIMLVFIRLILEWIAKLPVFNQLNMIGGFVLGALEGLLIVCLICAALTLFATSAEFEPVFKAVDSSLYTKFIYYNNFLLNWILARRCRASSCSKKL